MVDELLVLLAQASDADEDVSEIVEELENAAKEDPRVLAPHLGALIERGVLYPPLLFRGADDDVRRRLTALVDMRAVGVQTDLVMMALAGAGGPLAEDAFRRWLRNPPGDELVRYASVADYPCAGGWTLLADSGTRQLYGEVAYRLERTAELSGNVGAIVAETCPWCSSPLWTVLDIDTADERVAAAVRHTGWSGRLRVVTCYVCLGDPTFCEVNAHGGSRWSTLTVRPSWVSGGPPEQPNDTRLTIGAQRGVYSATAWDAGGSTLGGYPDWIQDWAYPACPRCHLVMDYIALVAGADLDGEVGQGAHYVFVHAACGIAGVGYQVS